MPDLKDSRLKHLSRGVQVRSRSVLYIYIYIKNRSNEVNNYRIFSAESS